MREIKFRIWDTLDEKFRNIVWGFNATSKMVFFDGYEGEFVESYGRYIPQQFTGLFDKNNVPIYEGDILIYRYSYEEAMIEAAHGNGEACDIELVVFEEGSFCFKSNKYERLSDSNLDMEVIGNIFQNQDLLK